MNATAQIKILIAEDASDQRAVLVALLQKAGYTTFEASEAYQARQIGQREVPDLILTDFKMPAGGGESLLQGLKKFAKTKSIPVIVITAAPDEARAHSEGCLGVVAKPVDGAKLLYLVREVLARMKHAAPVS
jgi:CheY-like chemotaxis protein